MKNKIIIFLWQKSNFNKYKFVRTMKFKLTVIHKELKLLNERHQLHFCVMNLCIINFIFLIKTIIVVTQIYMKKLYIYEKYLNINEI